MMDDKKKKDCPLCEVSDETLKILEEKGKDDSENNDKNHDS